MDQAAEMQLPLRYSTPAETLPPGAHFVMTWESQKFTAEVAATTDDRKVATLLLGTVQFAPGPTQPLTSELADSDKPVHFFELNLMPKQGR